MTVMSVTSGAPATRRDPRLIWGLLAALLVGIGLVAVAVEVPYLSSFVDWLINEVPPLSYLIVQYAVPIAFGALNDLTGVATSCFMLLFVLVSAALAWMHLAIHRMERRAAPELGELPQLPEMEGLARGGAAKPAVERAPVQAARPPIAPGFVPAQ